MKVIIFALSLLVSPLYASEGKPHVLWLVLEDTSPHFIGCYGNKDAKTPNMDQLAAQGIRFTRAFANSPVCSSARTTIISGAHNHILGTGNHRSAYPIPDFVKGFPTFLREKGYQTFNNVKTDYSTAAEGRLIRESWSESSRNAGWWKREGEAPFFAVFNYDSAHQSRTMTNSYEWYQQAVLKWLPAEKTIADEAFALPPFIPDSPAIRREFARVYNSIALADHQIGNLLDRLEKEGLSEDTIIFCYADHGEAMPRGKASPTSLGYQVPFIITFPPKWAHLNPWGKPGSTTDELISFDDLAPTMLSLAGLPSAKWMTGRAFLGKYRSEPPAHLFGTRNRIDETTGCARTIISNRYLYTRRFLHLPEVTPMKYFDTGEIIRELRKPGTLKPAEATMFAAAPHEVLYDLQQDPWQLNNLANDPQFASQVKVLRKQLFEHLLEAGDVLLLPEYEIEQISKNSTPYEYGQAMPLERRRAILSTANLASLDKPQTQLRELLGDEDPIVSYWAAVGHRLHPTLLEETRDLPKLDYPPAQIEFAAAQYLFNQSEEAAETLRMFTASPNPLLRLHALQRIQGLGEQARDFQDALEVAAKHRGLNTHSSAQVTLYLLGLGELSY